MQENKLNDDIETEELMINEITEFLESLEFPEHGQIRDLFTNLLSLLHNSHTKNTGISKYCSILTSSLLSNAKRAESLIRMSEDDGKTIGESEKELETIWKDLEIIESSAIKSEEMIESLTKQKQEMLTSLQKQTEKEELLKEEINQLEQQLRADASMLSQLSEDKQHMKSELQKLEYALIHVNETARKAEEKVENEETILTKARILRQSTESELAEVEKDTEYMRTEIGQFKSCKYQHTRAAKSLREERVESSSLLDIYRSEMAAHTCKINAKKRRLDDTIKHRERILTNTKITERKLSEISNLIDDLKSQTETTNAVNEEMQMECNAMRDQNAEINRERGSTGRSLKETEKSRDLLIFAVRASLNENSAKERQIQATAYNADMALVSLEKEKQATEREEHFNKFIMAEIIRTKNDNFEQQMRASSIPMEIHDLERERDEILPGTKVLEAKTKTMNNESAKLRDMTEITKREIVIAANRVASEKTLLNMVERQVRSINEDSEKLRAEIAMMKLQNDDAERAMMDMVVECLQLYCDRLEAEKRVARLEKTTRSYEKLLSDSEKQQKLYEERISGLNHTLEEAESDIASKQCTANLNVLTDRIYDRELQDRCSKIEQLNSQIYTMNCELRMKADHFDKQTKILRNMTNVLEMEKHKHAFLRRKLNSIPSCKRRIVKLEREILKMQRFRAAMETSHTTPMNIHRWQILDYQNSPYSKQIRQMLYLRSTVEELDHTHTELLEKKAELEKQYKMKMSHLMNVELVHDQNMILIAKNSLNERNKCLDQLKIDIDLKKEEVSDLSAKVAKLQCELDNRERAERLKRKKTITTVSSSRKVSVRKRETSSPFVTQNNSRSPRKHFKPRPPVSQNNSFARRSNF